VLSFCWARWSGLLTKSKREKRLWFLVFPPLLDSRRLQINRR